MPKTRTRRSHNQFIVQVMNGPDAGTTIIEDPVSKYNRLLARDKRRYPKNHMIQALPFKKPGDLPNRY